MDHLISILFIIVIVCLGVRLLTDDYMIFYPIRMWAEALYIKKEWTKFILFPTIICERCYASFWGTIVNICYWSFVNNDYLELVSSYHVFLWIVTCISASFFNGLFWNIYTLIRKHS